MLSGDDRQVASKTIPHTIPFLVTIDETLDVGVDTHSPMDDSYQGPFRFTGKRNKWTVQLKPVQLAAQAQTAPKSRSRGETP